MIYYINKVECLAQGMQKENHPIVFTQTRCQSRVSSTRESKQRKLNYKRTPIQRRGWFHRSWWNQTRN